MNIKKLQSEILQFIHPSHLQKCSFVFLYDLEQHCTGWYLQKWPFLKSFRWNGSRKKQLEGFRRGGVWPKDFKLHNVFVQNLIEEAGRGERKAAVCWRNGHAHYWSRPTCFHKRTQLFNFSSCANRIPRPCLFGKASEIFGAPNLIISMCNKLEGQQRPLFAPDTTKK